MRKFGIGDKVFAKVRGYPAWPARIIAIADETPNKLRYHVFFYGTLETAICKTEDLYAYAENKENYGKPSKRKFFNEGLAQIEGRAPVPDPRGVDSSKHDEVDSDAEGTLVIDENPSIKYGKPGKRKRESDSTGEDVDEKKLLSATGSDSIKSRRSSLPAQKRLKKDSTSSGISSDSKYSETHLGTKPEVVSRSGRKIKPKRFADEEAFNHSSVSTADSENTETILIGQSESDPSKLPASFLECDGIEQSGKDTNVNNIATKRVDRKDDKLEPFMVRVKERRKLQLERCKKEFQMLILASRIKRELSLRKANPEQGLKALSELYCLGVDSLMLKKYPHVVETITKLVRYVGNPKGWKYSKEQKRLFVRISEKIKAKAKLVIDEFSTMFNVPEGSPFYDVFCESVSEFQEKTNNMDREKFYTLMEDPTLSDS